MDNTNSYVNFTPYDEQMAELQRRQKMADLLQQQTMQTLETPQSGGRMVAKVSPLAGLAKILQAYNVGKEQKNLEQQRLEAGKADLTSAMDLYNKVNTPRTVYGEGQAIGLTPNQAGAINLPSTVTPPPSPFTAEQAGALNQPEQPQAREARTVSVPYSKREIEGLALPYLASGGPRSQMIAQILMNRKQPSAWDYIEKPKLGEGGVSPEGFAEIERAIAQGREPSVAALKLQPKQKEAPADEQGYNLAVSQGYKGTFLDYKKDLARSGATNVNVPVNTEKTYSGAIAGKLADADFAAIDAARSAPSQIDGARRIKSLLLQNPITGTAANQRLQLDKLLGTAGLIDPSRSITTENLVTELANGTLSAIQTSGLGKGQGFTDNDLKFLQQAKSGTISLTPQNLQYIADLNEKAAIASINKGNNVISRLKKSRNFGPEFGLDLIEIPKMTPLPPAGFVPQRQQ